MSAAWSQGGRPPSIDALARSLDGADLPHALRVDAARSAIEAGRPDQVVAHALAIERRLLGPVVNATGVVLHTNLGRAPLAADRPAGYSNLELDLETGERGSRSDHAAWLLARLTGADDALVVNNGAAALMLVLAAVADGGGVVVSRGELVQIGGGFRLPDVLEQSGAELIEVGTTNWTEPEDYRRAIDDHDPAPSLLLKVHQSNFRIDGFTRAAPTSSLRGMGPPLVVDVGSGLIDTATPWLAERSPSWLRGEPGVRQTLADGADLVTFSGDKLLGGPQAGVIVGRGDLVARCARHPLYRALRCGGHVLDAVQDVVLRYIDGTAGGLPIWRMLTTPVEELRKRASEIVEEAAMAVVGDGPMEATVGGGSVPGSVIDSWGLVVAGDRRRSLRRARPLPIVARARDGFTQLDLRTVDPAHDSVLVDALRSLG
jgi:L-seryl-tRNA(Ser) seleniumtransferase